MAHYSVQSRDRIFANSYEFLSYAKNMGRDIGKNVSKILSSKYSQILIDHANQCAADGLKIALKRAIKKTAKGTGDLIVNKNKNNNLETNEEEILREKFIFYN